MVRSIFAAALVTAVSSIATQSLAQTYPTRPVRVIMPIPVGSGLDIVTRVLAEELGSRLGQQIVVENRPGGGGLIATQAVTAAAPDGYTLLGAAGSIWLILPAQKEKLPIDVNRDLVPIGVIAGGPMTLAVSPKLGVASMQEFIALARSQPQKIVVGTNGAGTLPHFAALVLAMKADIPITVLPYSTGGTSEAIRDIMGGRIHATVEAAFGLRAPLQSGELKLIGVLATERDRLFPSVPTMAETVPGLSLNSSFTALAAPAATPNDIVQRLSDGLTHALRTARVQARFTDLGMQARIMSPPETKLAIERAQKDWWPLVAATSRKQ